MKIRVQKKTPVVWAVEVQGRHLASAMYQFDNLHEIREICEWSFISWEDVVVDQASGLIRIPGVGAVTLGCYLIESSGKGLEAYDSFEALQRDYRQVEEQCSAED